MSDLIDRQAAINLIHSFSALGYIEEDTEKIVNTLKELPSAESEREMGRWMFSPDHAEGICTNCNYKIYGRPYNNTYLIVPYNFCPNCGADMRGGENG